jgi:hypothetical protein
MRRRFAALAFAALPIACADPCVDDGVNQEKKGECPGQAASASETEGGTGTSGTEDASASATQTESADATQGSMSADASATETEDASASEPTGDASADATDTSADASATGGPGCSNGVLDGDESDVDCGGSCPPCDDGKVCNTSDDCESMMCTTDMICGGEDSCTELIDDNGCQACIKANCCEAVLECFMDEFCHCWVECIEQNNDFDPCVDECMGTAKPGAITSCANSNCNEVGACGN